MGKYILALDQGTTSSRAILFDEAERMVGVAQQEFSQIYPQEGWVEQNPMEIYSSQYAVMMEVIARTGVNVGEIAAIGITNQRETTILWDKATGQPIYNAIVWQCRRTAKIVEDLVAAGLGDHIKERTGLVPDAYSAGVYLVPAFTGLGAPYWDMYARGVLIGITRGTKREHISNAGPNRLVPVDSMRTLEKEGLIDKLHI